MLFAVATVERNSAPIKIYYFETGERVATLDGHLDLVYNLSWSSDDRFHELMIGFYFLLRLMGLPGYGNFLWMEKSLCGRFYLIQSLFIAVSFIHCLIHQGYSNSSRVFASGAYDGRVRFWAQESHHHGNPSKAFKTILAHSNCVNSLVFSNDGQKMYTGSGSGIIKIWGLVHNDTQNMELEKLNYECISIIDTLKVNSHLT
jgi:jouberin